MQSLSTLLSAISSGTVPSVILVGGDNDFLTEQTYHSVRDALLHTDPTLQVESFSETSDLGVVLDSYRTMTLFGGARLLVVPELNAFVTRKELSSLYEKAVGDWSSAKTERKRGSAMAKLLHLLGLIGADVDTNESEIVEAAGARGASAALSEMLRAAREGGKKATRGEGDAALLAEAVARGGAPGAVLLLRAGEIPRDSATVDLIERKGAVIVANLTREQVPKILDSAIEGVGRQWKVRFDPAALKLMRQRLGVDRMLTDKFSRDLPDIRLFVSEAERLATFVGEGGVVTGAVVASQIETAAGGARYEFASLFSEKKPIEAVAKLRDLVAQGRREDPRTPLDIHYGRYIFALADEIRQLLGIRAFCRMQNIDLRRSIQYNRFRDSLAEAMSDYLKTNALVKQKPHPFALHKRFEAARNYDDSTLLDALNDVAEIEFLRKCGGLSAETGLESLVLRMGLG